MTMTMAKAHIFICYDGKGGINIYFYGFIKKIFLFCFVFEDVCHVICFSLDKEKKYLDKTIF